MHVFLQKYSKLHLGFCPNQSSLLIEKIKECVGESSPGCLMFSFTSQMNDARMLPLMQYVVFLAMTEAIKDLCCAKGLPELDVRIKWPNDLYLKG